MSRFFTYAKAALAWAVIGFVMTMLFSTGPCAETDPTCVLNWRP